MLNFKEYLKRGKVLKRTPDQKMAESLEHDAAQRLAQSKITGLQPKFRFELIYDSIRELADALLARDGYKTYSHEAAITYFKELEKINDAELERLDLCRKTRNDSKYYGEELPDTEYTDLCEFMIRLHKKIQSDKKRAKNKS